MILIPRVKRECTAEAVQPRLARGSHASMGAWDGCIYAVVVEPMLHAAAIAKMSVAPSMGVVLMICAVAEKPRLQ